MVGIHNIINGRALATKEASPETDTEYSPLPDTLPKHAVIIEVLCYRYPTLHTLRTVQELSPYRGILGDSAREFPASVPV